MKRFRITIMLTLLAAVLLSAAPSASPAQAQGRTCYYPYQAQVRCVTRGNPPRRVCYAVCVLPWPQPPVRR